MEHTGGGSGFSTLFVNFNECLVDNAGHLQLFWAGQHIAEIGIFKHLFEAQLKARIKSD